MWWPKTLPAKFRNVARLFGPKSPEYKKHLTESMNELKTLIAAAETAAKASRAERADALVEIDTKRKSLQITITAVETQLAKVTAAAKPA